MISAAEGDQAYCATCFHGWRPDFPIFGYSDTTMCSHDMGRARYEAQIRFFRPFAPRDATILELGCATGTLAAMVRELMPLKRYDGIEMSPSGEKARQHLDNLYTEALPQLLKNGEVSACYDLILMSHVLEHLKDPAAELRAMKRVLAPGGAIFLEVPNRSGHPHLPIDDNIFHLHFFCTSSLSRMLAKEGLDTVAEATGVRVDARCTDAFQVIARPFAPPSWSKTLLSDHPMFAGENEIVVWAAGGTAKALLANFFDVSRIAFFIDNDTLKQASPCLGRPVRPPEALGRKPRTVLINSIDFVDSIAADIERLYPGVGHRIVRIGDLLFTNGKRDHG